MKKKIYLLNLLLALSICAWAQDENLKMRFDFSNVSGTSVTDDVSGITGQLADVASVRPMGAYHVLDLGDGAGYFDMTKKAGELLAATDNFSISVYYRINESASVNGNGFFLWNFSTLAECNQTAGVSMSYRLNAQRASQATAGWGSQKYIEVGSQSAKGKWIHLAYTQQGNTGKLYINGSLIGTVTDMPLNSKQFGTTKPANCWLGRSPYPGDSYLKQTLVTDFRLYDKALSSSEVTKLATETENLDEAYIHGTKGDVTKLNEAITEAENVLGSSDSYLLGAIEDLQQILKFAKIVSAGSFSQAYIDNVATQLKDQISIVKNSEGITMPTVMADMGCYDTKRGFRHPGGLHSQADFDRIKRQLAENNEKVTKAFEQLKSSQYAQPTTYYGPTETIIRGGSGQNYINAARAAATAYQNGLRWKIEGNEACAKQAVKIMNAWAATTKAIGGDTNYALGAGLYGYQFAQAAELLRDYPGWSEADFKAYKRWMLDVWYPSNTYFMRARNGTWQNNDHWWQAPGHYWSNWGLCNALSLISIGVLCDDVAIYNQGMGYFKYDQVGTFKDPRTGDKLQNDGLDEFLGNLVVTTSESDLETGAYGKLGQMQESGRDIGHATMALGLAVDLAKVGWNQGDDLFAYMDHRLAAGIEFVAGQEQALEGMPWTPYEYYDVRTAPGSGWTQGSYATGSQKRKYWGTVLGIYEGVKGVKMPLAETSYENMGIDGVTSIGVSGDCDHLGYSVLTTTYDEQLASQDKVPTELTAKMEYDGELSSLIPSIAGETTRGLVEGNTTKHSELGALISTYSTNNKNSVPQGHTIKLIPGLPEGEEDTGNWKWDTGETTKDITVSTDRSYVYRVTYTNKNGVQSYLSFPIAVEYDCEPATIVPSVTYGGKTMDADTIVAVVYGETATLKISPKSSWGTYMWSSGQTSQSITTCPIFSPREYTAYYVNQVSGVSKKTFHINVEYAQQFITIGSEIKNTNEAVVNVGDAVTLSISVPTLVTGKEVHWSNGTTGKSVTIESVESSKTYTATFEFDGQEHTYTFNIYAKPADNTTIASGDYTICERATGKLLTAHEINMPVTFEEGNVNEPAKNQSWFITYKSGNRLCFTNLNDSLSISTTGITKNVKTYGLFLKQAVGSNYYALHTGYSDSSAKYWIVNEDGTLNITSTSLDLFPYEILPIKTAGINNANEETPTSRIDIFDINGRRLNEIPKQKGIYIINGKKIVR